MTAREQFSWVWLLTLLVTYSVYFGWVLLARAGPAPSMITELIMFGGTALAQVAIIAIASLVIGLRHRGEGGLDERDRRIAHQAGTLAYHVLITGFIVVGCVMPFSKGGWDIVHAAIFAIAVAEIIRLIAVVRGYRRFEYA
jgi:uncharacterized membrane protein